MSVFGHEDGYIICVQSDRPVMMADGIWSFRISRSDARRLMRDIDTEMFLDEFGSDE